LAVPVNVTVAPPPAVVGVMAPDKLYVNVVVVKFSPVTFVPLTEKLKLVGLNVKPALLGVTV
jgi:hypothetical protein